MSCQLPVCQLHDWRGQVFAGLVRVKGLVGCDVGDLAASLVPAFVRCSSHAAAALLPLRPRIPSRSTEKRRRLLGTVIGATTLARFRARRYGDLFATTQTQTQTCAFRPYRSSVGRTRRH